METAGPERRRGLAGGAKERRSPGAIAVSVVAHVVVIGALLRMVALQGPFGSFLIRDDRVDAPAERIQYVEVAPSVPSVIGRDGGDGRPAARTPVPPPLVAPREVPSGIPPAPPAPAPAPDVRVEGETDDGEGSGPIVGRGGPTRGIRPQLNDPRIWTSAPPLVAEPKTDEERLDSVVTADVKRFTDSVRANSYSPNKFERGDWTVEKGGQKWGVDQKFIRLGKVSIPTALLGLLPINAQGNPIAYERNKQLAAMRAEIQYHAQVSMNEDEFRKAVKSIRERKERERRAQEDARKKDEAKAPIATPGPSRD